MSMTAKWLRRTGFGGVVGLAVVLGATGCKSNSNAPIVDSSQTDASDPADANMAPVNGAAPVYTTQQQPARVLGQQSQGPPPQENGESYADQGPYGQAYDQDQEAVDAGQQALYADQAPPPLPEYQQPELTEAGYEWTPGYWSYGSEGYYWVPGAWVAPPYVGALWTPGYWGWYSGRYRFHHGFWGSHIGFYGGINYGFGYTGSGYHGGYWQGNNFYYNQQVNRVNVSAVRNVYSHNVPVVNNTRYSFNGPQGVNARPSAVDVAVYHERIVPAMQVQVQHAQAAAANRQQFYGVNQPMGNGRPVQGQPMQQQQEQRVQDQRVQQQQQMRDQQMRQQPQGQPQRQQEINQQQRQAPPVQQQVRPVPQQQAVPQPQQQARPDQRQQQEQQRQQQQRQAPQPQPAARPAPQPQQQPQRQPQPQPQPQQRPAPQPHPQQEAHPAPAPPVGVRPVARPEPPHDEHPKG